MTTTGQCDCCGAERPLTSIVAYGIDTSACAACRGNSGYTVRSHGIDNRYNERAFADADLASKFFADMTAAPRIIHVELLDGDDDVIDHWSDEEWNG